MSYRSQNNAIRGLRRKYPNVGQRTLARAIVSRNPSVISDIADRIRVLDPEKLTERTFASVYGVIRRHDSNAKAKAATPVLV